MSMLSRVAERLYWMARYLERAEMTARLCNAYSQLILDIPKGSALSWDTLVTIIDGESVYNQRYQVRSERNILKFMIADKDNPVSVRQSIIAARENVRTTRDVLPEELWELYNELYIYVDEKAERSIARRNRFDFLQEIVARSQQINGLIASAVTRDQAYRFIQMGQLIERADMSSRTIDTALETLMSNPSDKEGVKDVTLVWASLLNSVSAMAAYRREVGPLVNGDDVAEFLLKNESFPRSIEYCIHGTKNVFSHLKKHTALVAELDETLGMLDKFDIEKTDLKAKHQFIDKLQKQLYKVNQGIYATWFD